ncbi:hypothetical protein [Mycobacterium paraense]|uniref:hypothetical protein n=1 Tax=Mycobacterium paraense TaxID=767916 RepID=UPI00111BE7FE|nr:hypothetical protein [Mycobacterium paraense]
MSTLVKPRKLPPEMGWRKTVYTLTGHSLNLGAGPAEPRLRDQIAAIGADIPGNYQIGSVSVNSGIGKTRTTAGIGTAFALYRTKPVVAIDAHPTYGNLGRLIDPHATASIRGFMADTQMVAYPKARSYTGKHAKGAWRCWRGTRTWPIRWRCQRNYSPTPSPAPSAFISWR